MKRLISALSLLALLVLAACGSDHESTPVIVTPSVAAATVGIPYSQTLVAIGGTIPYTWRIDAGALPVGLSMSTAGVISGTPTAAGSSTFTATVVDSKAHIFFRSYTLVVAVPGVLTITTTSPLPAGVIGTAYSQQFAATGGTGALTWAVTTGTLPTGLTLSAAGLLSGTPTAAGISTFSVTVTDSTAPTPHTATVSFSLTVTAVGLAITTTSPLPAGVVGTAYSQQLAASGGTGALTWAVTTGTLPAGLTLSAAGLLSGTPTAAGTSAFSVTVTDSAVPTPHTATASFSLTVGVTPPALAVTTTTLPVEVLGTAYSQTLTASGGVGTLTWTIASGALPPGLALNAATGVISGTPLTAGSGTFTAMVTDSTGPTATSGSLTITSFTAAGLTSFNTSCGGCHGTITAGVGVSGSPIVFPSSITALNNAITNIGSMNSLSSLPVATRAAIAGVLF